MFLLEIDAAAEETEVIARLRADRDWYRRLTGKFSAQATANFQALVGTQGRRDYLIGA